MPNSARDLTCVNAAVRPMPSPDRTKSVSLFQKSVTACWLRTPRSLQFQRSWTYAPTSSDADQTRSVDDRVAALGRCVAHLRVRGVPFCAGIDSWSTLSVARRMQRVQRGR